MQQTPKPIVDTSTEEEGSSTSISPASLLDGLLQSQQWTASFNPKTIDDLGLPSDIVDFYKLIFWSQTWPLSSGLISNNQDCTEMSRIFPPHIMLHGPPGTGKTTFANMMCANFFAPYHIFSQTNVKRMNASCDRGIDIVRNQISAFAMFDSQRLTLPDASLFRRDISEESANAEMRQISGRRFIILDECDNLTPESQGALRKVIEENSQNTRFILICNNYSALLDALVSRCRVFRFRPLCQESVSYAMARMLGNASLLLPKSLRHNYLPTLKNVCQSEAFVSTMTMACSGDGRRLVEYTRRAVTKMVGSLARLSNPPECNVHEMTISACAQVIADSNTVDPIVIDGIVSSFIFGGIKGSSLGKSWVTILKIYNRIGVEELGPLLAHALNRLCPETISSIHHLSKCHNLILNWMDLSGRDVLATIPHLLKCMLDMRISASLQTHA